MPLHSSHFTLNIFLLKQLLKYTLSLTSISLTCISTQPSFSAISLLPFSCFLTNSYQDTLHTFFVSFAAFTCYNFLDCQFFSQFDPILLVSSYNSYKDVLIFFCSNLMDAFNFYYTYIYTNFTFI